MKRVFGIIVCALSVFFLTTGQGYAAKSFYKTYTVTKVTEDHIVLQRKYSDKEVVLDKARRPGLEVGDKVRYDRVRNRLRRTLVGKE